MDETTLSKASPEVRIGDFERQAAARQLQQHFADGRLTWEELDERLAVAYAARVNAELTRLFTDLPMLAPPAPPAPPRSRFQGTAARLGSVDMRRLVLLVIAAAIAIGVTRGIIIPIAVIWWFAAGHHRHHGRHPGNRHGSHHDHRGRRHHGNAWS